MFLKRWQVRHELSSPGYPQSNGRAEAAVEAAKKLLRGCWNWRDQRLDPELSNSGIMQLRNTPGPNGLSSAQLVFGMPVQDALPAHRRQFTRQSRLNATEAYAAASREKIEHAYKQRADDLPAQSQLHVGRGRTFPDALRKRTKMSTIIIKFQDKGSFTGINPFLIAREIRKITGEVELSTHFYTRHH